MVIFTIFGIVVSLLAAYCPVLSGSSRRYDKMSPTYIADMEYRCMLRRDVGSAAYRATGDGR